MGFLDEMFDSERRQRNDINALKEAALDAALAQGTNSHLAPKVYALEVEVNQLKLLCNALVSVIEQKKLATREELEVLVQQLDLFDGKEDGKISPTAWRDAPRCAACNRFVNPERETCVYCGRSLALQGAMIAGPYRGAVRGADEAAPAPRTATCANCGEVTPQSETYFTEEGELHCTKCYQG